MSAIWQLTRADGKHLLRDPMLALSLAAPLLLIVLLRFGAPLLFGLVKEKVGIDLIPYTDLLLVIALLLVALMEGILTGLLMLDERDEQLLSYYAVTPLTKSGYALYRLTVPFILGIIGGIGLLLFSGLYSGPLMEAVPILLLAAAGGPLYALALAAIAANKVEGLALSKVIGAMVLLPVASLFLPGAWGWVCAVFPTFWPIHAFVAAGGGWPGEPAAGSGIATTVYLTAGFVYQLVWLWLGCSAFFRKVE